MACPGIRSSDAGRRARRRDARRAHRTSLSWAASTSSCHRVARRQGSLGRKTRRRGQQVSRGQAGRATGRAARSGSQHKRERRTASAHAYEGSQPPARPPQWARSARRSGSASMVWQRYSCRSAATTGGGSEVDPRWPGTLAAAGVGLASTARRPAARKLRQAAQ